MEATFVVKGLLADKSVPEVGVEPTRGFPLSGF